MIYSKEFLTKVAKAHRAHGMNVTRQSKKGKQYMTFRARAGLGEGTFSFREHIAAIFPDAYVTSALYGPNFFEMTFRINP